MSEVKSDKLSPVTATTTTFGDSGDKLLFTTGTNLDMNGTELILDADADTSITADTDDQIDIKIAGADDFQFTANKFLVQTGSNIDMNGTELILDADADTSITADTDDQIDVKIAGADDFRFTANNFNILSGSTLTVDSGATITNSGTANGFGKLVQIKSMSTTTQTYTTGTTFVATGLTLAFTQVAAGNYIYIVATAPAGGGLSSSYTQSRGHYGLFKGASEIARTSHNFIVEHTPAGDWGALGFAQVVTFYGSAGDTSAHTYTVQIKDQWADASSTIYWNYYVTSASTSTITIMEFAV